MIQHGINPNKVDHRDYGFFQTFGGTQIEKANLPAELLVDAGLWMPSQYEYDPIFANLSLPYGCTDYTSCDLCADQDGVLYNPAFTESITGANQKMGYDIRDSLLTTVKIGTKTKEGTITKRTGVFNVQKYDILDYFDSIRYAMFQNITEKRSISLGTPWYKEWEDAALAGTSIMPAPKTYAPDGLPWHNSKICGWKTMAGQPVLVVKSWQGKKIGDNGWVYFTRDVFNATMSIRGTCAFTVSKLDQGEQIQKISVPFMDWFYSVLRNIFTNVPVPNQPIMQNTQEPAVKVEYLWDTAINSRHSIRVICDEEGLSVADKNIITACIQQESQFNNAAINNNKNAAGEITSSDWGICQINDYFQMGKGKPFPSVQYVIDNPEKAVRWMVGMMKAGKLNLWSSYSTGAYKKWLV